MDELDELARARGVTVDCLLEDTFAPCLSKESAQATALAIRRNVALGDSKLPLARILFLGSETAALRFAGTLGEALHGRRHGILFLDMEQYHELYMCSGLIDSNGGMVCWYFEGALTRMFRHPEATILLGNIDRAHLDALEVMAHVLGTGHYVDYEGNSIPLGNTAFILSMDVDPEAAESEARSSVAGPLPAELLRAFDVIVRGR